MDRSRIHVLFVDDDEVLRELVERRFSQLGFSISVAESPSQTLHLFAERNFDIAVLDLRMPGMNGLELLQRLKESDVDCEFIMLSGEASVEAAVAAMKQGAYDFLQKPIEIKQLEALVLKAYAHRQLAKENRQLKTVLQRQRSSSRMIGESPPMKELFRLIERAGPSDKAILIQGESGTGKELVARALHQSSLRADKPLVVINCAALPETLLESELFGHEKGAFTGAISAKAGLFEIADGGTLFIDEVGELPGSLQAKLLRVLEDGSLRRIGALKERHVDVRLLAATNRNMAKEVAENRFREDLYYRINVMSLELPPLRARGEDLDLIVDHFLGADWEIEEEALRALETYHWPGNVRQLLNALDRAKILAEGGLIRLQDLPSEVRHGHTSAKPVVINDTDDLATIQRSKVMEVLERVKGNKTKAARALGIDRRKVYRLIERLNLTAANLER
jgi:DNA-binding NtrC family response regulator